MDMLFGEFETFGDGLETRKVILVHKTSSLLSQWLNAAAKTSAGEIHYFLPDIWKMQRPNDKKHAAGVCNGLLQRPNDMSKTSYDTRKNLHFCFYQLFIQIILGQPMLVGSTQLVFRPL